MRLLCDLLDPARVASGELDGSATALTDGAVALTWSEYTDRVARLSAVLVGAGVAPGDRVGVRLPKSCASFVAVHAVLRAGAVMVPLDPLAPIGPAAAVVEDAGLEVLITDRSSAARIDALTGVRCIVLPGVDAAVAGVTGVTVIDEADIARTAPGPAARVEPDDPAYIIYTSGSTGTPKGIVHTHASALAYAEAAVEEYALGSGDRFANIAPLHFDQSTFELYAAPLVGGTVLVVPDPVLRFPASVSELVARERITVWYSVPYLLEQLATRGVLAERDLGALRWVLFGGESFPPGALAGLMQQLPHATFSNVYGPAEVNQCTAYHLGHAPTGPVPIGAAWKAARVRLVDPDDLTTDITDSSPGVVLVATATMMAGYWNRPDLTAASTQVDDDGTRWYVTGDLAAVDESGSLVFLGRVDNQVKVRGHRIELEAIDTALRAAPRVEAATVVVVRPGDGDDRLVALVQLAPARPDSDDDDLVEHHDATSVILDTLRARLPRYAVPSTIRVVASLPRTATGKVDRNASGALVAGTPR